MPGSPYRNISSADQSQFDQMVKSSYICGCILTLMFAVFLVSNYTDTKPVVIPDWVLVMAILMPCLGMYGSLRYKLQPTLRTFFQLLELTALSCFSLVCTYILDAGLHGKLAWLYRDYLWYYGIGFVAELLIALFLPRLRRRISRRIKEKCELVEAYTRDGVITGGGAYRSFFTNDTVSAQSQKPVKYVVGMGAFVSVAIGVVALGGGKYLLYYSFIAALLSAPFILAILIHRRVFYRRYLVNDRIAIVREL